MKVFIYLVDDVYNVDNFILENERRLQEAPATVRMFIKDLRQKKIRLGDGKALLIVILEYSALWNVAPKWLLSMGLKRSLRNAGYSGKIEKATAQQALKELIT